MTYLLILMGILGLVIGAFALSKGEGSSYSRNQYSNSKSDGDDHFNSFTL